MEPGKVIFITPAELDKASLPEDLRKSLRHFQPDPSIPLPVEFSPVSGENAGPPGGSISREMILSGLLWELAENPREAVYYRGLAAALKPGMYDELTEAAILKARNGDYKTALDIFSLLEGLRPRFPALLLNKALTLEERACSLENINEGAETAFAAAEAAFEAALTFPLNDTLFYAGLFYYRRADYKRSADCFSAYLEKGLESAEGINRDSEKSGNGEEPEPPAEQTEKQARAEELLEEIRKNGLDDKAFKEALTLIRGGEEEKGILKVRDFLERRPNAGNGWFVLGWGLRRLDRWEDGAACFEKALELGTVNTDILNELAICRMELGDYGEARRLLEKALREEPDSVRLISNLGILALKQGRDDEAAAFFRTVLELDPNDPIAKVYLAPGA
jgi:tetratricopeptide (TPR) repeat protein